MSGSKDFFKEQKLHSKVKAEIVSEYFAAWAAIMIGQTGEPITYFDLFSGQGIYDDGGRSTPILVLDEIGKNPALIENIKLHFWEGDRKFYTRLKEAIEKHPVFNSLAHEPQIQRLIIDSKILSKITASGPSFTFIDPTGYKGVSLSLLYKALQEWGCDCVFYLSISGIERNIDKEHQVAELEGLLGNGATKRLKETLQCPSTNKDFDQAVFLEMKQSLAALGIEYILPFAVETRRNRVSHYLVFASKHPLGFKKMKEIMGKHSQMDGDGFPSYLWTGLPFQLKLPLDSSLMIKLAESFSTDYFGRTYIVRKFYDLCHKRGCKYREKDIKKSLLWLECEGRLWVDKKSHQRPKRYGELTLGESRRIKFV